MTGLQMSGLVKRFDGLVAVDQVDLTVESGEILGLIGPNGSGKSTVVNVATGILALDEGTVTVDGRDITGQPPSAVSRAGVARTFQTVRLFDGLSVRDNVAAVASHPDGRLDGYVISLLEQLGIAERVDTRAGELPYGLKRRLEIARALATQPSYLLLDEPAAGLNDVESEDLERVISSLPDQIGCGVLLIDHDLRLISALCDRLQVLANGRTIAEGDPETVRNDPKVVMEYLGKETE